MNEEREGFCSSCGQWLKNDNIKEKLERYEDLLVKFDSLFRELNDNAHMRTYTSYCGRDEEALVVYEDDMQQLEKLQEIVNSELPEECWDRPEITLE